MKIISPSFKIEFFPDDILTGLEMAGRTCYLSEPGTSEESTNKFIRRIVASGHSSVLEHRSISIRIICDRGVMAELTRHRLASFSIESSRYCNYSKKEIEFIKPCFWQENEYLEDIWELAMEDAEGFYKQLISEGATPEQARSVLPMSLKTEIVITANVREWLHIFNLRCSKKSHPQMREIMLPLLQEFSNRCPVIFGDLWEVYKNV